MNLYLDSSALAKGYIAEVHSAEVAALIGAADISATSWLAIPEVLSAVARLRRSGNLEPITADAARLQFTADSERYLWIATDRALLEDATNLVWRHWLRAADAVHLAAAQQCASMLGLRDIVFATFDKQLARAARAEGLNVWPEDDGAD